MLNHWHVRLLLAVGFAGSMLFSEMALSTIVDVRGPFHFRSNTGLNSAGINAGDRHKVGVVYASPNGDGGTTGVAVAPDGFTRDLIFDPNPRQPNRFIIGPDFNPGRVGPWQLTFSNGADTTRPILTPGIAGVGLMPFVKNVKLMGAGLAPTISWDLPFDKLAASGLEADYISVWIRDLADMSVINTNTGGRIAAVIASTGPVDPAINSVTLDASLLGGVELEFGHRYSIQVNMQDTRDGTWRTAQVKSNSVAFFDFTPLEDDPSGGAGILLPTVSSDGAGGAVFKFEADVAAGEVLYIDPYIAVGYDYAIGVGDPNFASLLLPAVGDDLYELWLWSGVDWVMADTLEAGVEYFFGPGGVDRFRVLGIETNAMLNPEDPSAFVTGLRFTADGKFTGTMTPLLAWVGVPSPSGLLLVLIGGLVLRRQLPTTV